MEASLTAAPFPFLAASNEDTYARCYFTPSSSFQLKAKTASGSTRPSAAFVKLQPLRFAVRCSGSGSRSYNGGGGVHNGNQQWDKEDDKYLEAQVVEAVSLLPSQGHLFMTMANGGEVEVCHLNPPKGKILYRTRNPTIFLKILPEAELLLPIIVGDVAVGMLMKALHNEEATARPNQYHLLKNIVGSLNFEVRMVRVTERVADTYFSRIFIGRPGEKEMLSVDARPSDAINLAVRCKVPIYVNEDIVYADAVKPVHTTTQRAAGISNRNRSSALDLPENGPDPVAEEMTLMRNMLVAVVEERYKDAARWRDELNHLRSHRQRIRQL